MIAGHTLLKPLLQVGAVLTLTQTEYGCCGDVNRYTVDISLL